jgi:uncharacterized protein (TIGR02246 family)
MQGLFLVTGSCGPLVPGASLCCGSVAYFHVVMRQLVQSEGKEMMKRLFVILNALLFLCGLATAQNSNRHSKDEAAIRAIIVNLEEAWTKGDGQLWGKQFAEDVDFTVWNGLYFKGREAITKSHAEIFNTIFKGEKLRHNLLSIRFLRDDVAVVRTAASHVKKEEEFPSRPMVFPLYVMTKEKGRWQIVVFQNTKNEQSQDAAK